MESRLPPFEIIVFLNIQLDGLFNQCQQLYIAWNVSYQHHFVLRKSDAIYKLYLRGPCHFDSKICFSWDDIHQIIIFCMFSCNFRSRYSIRISGKIIFLLICYFLGLKVSGRHRPVFVDVQIAPQVVVLLNIYLPLVLIFGLQNVQVVLRRVHAVLSWCNSKDLLLNRPFTRNYRGSLNSHRWPQISFYIGF